MKPVLLPFRVRYKNMTNALVFEDVTIDAETLEDARVLAKYRIEIATDNEFQVIEVYCARSRYKAAITLAR